MQPPEAESSAENIETCIQELLKDCFHIFFDFVFNEREAKAIRESE